MKTNKTTKILFLMFIASAIMMYITASMSTAQTGCGGKNQAECNAASPACMWAGDTCVEAGGGVDCPNITTEPVCNNAQGCWWDAGINPAQCVFGGSGPECYKYDPETCKHTAGCNWNPAQWKCEEGSIANCTEYNTPIMCESYGECDWNGTECVLSPCASNCSACNETDSCQKSPRDCWWDFPMSECREHMQPTCENGMCDMCNTSASCAYCNDEENCSYAVNQATCDSYDYCQWNGSSCITSCVEGQNVDNMFCAWFESPQWGPGGPAPSQPMGIGIMQSGGGPGGPSNCMMNTTCAQDCFKCDNEAECIASNNSAFGGAQGNESACAWDALSGWIPCFVKGDHYGVDCHSLQNQGECDPNPDCEWNTQSSQCEPTGPGGPCNSNCSLCGDEWSCYESPAGCTYDSTSSPPCSQDNCFTLGCGYCNDQQDCMQADGKWRHEGADGCIWWRYDNNTEVCKDKDCETDCNLCAAESACNSSTAECEWHAGGAAADLRTLQANGTCLFSAGSAQACNVDCTQCYTNGDCFNSYAGCDWSWQGQIHEVKMENNIFYVFNETSQTWNVTNLTILQYDSIKFINNDSENHTATSDPGAFDLPLAPDETYHRDFYAEDEIGVTFTVYCTIQGIGVMNMTVTVNRRNSSNTLCQTNDCKHDCGQCNDPGACDRSYSDCFWDMKDGMCRGKGFGGGCADDCWGCNTELKCNASNATMWTPMGQMNGCQWVFDFMDGVEACRPAGMGFDCDSMCEQCNETECENATPTMLPPDSPGCKWFQHETTPAGTQGACHPDGHSGMGHGCAQYDFTSRAECEGQAGCIWFDIDRICNPDFNQMTCNERCDLCNETECNQKAPKCIWDTPPFGDPFCREDMWTGGGNCEGNCFDCFDNQSCTQSTADCRWVLDPKSPSGGHCDPADMKTCDEVCFACFMPSDCATSQNTLFYNDSVTRCQQYNDQSSCDADSWCAWNATSSACESIIAQSCEWDSQDQFCKPTNYPGEICFMPGDEDSDGLEGCKDPDCDDDPFCMFMGGEGPMGMDIDCYLWDEMNGGNRSVCECDENATLVNDTCVENGTEVNGTGCVWHLVDKPPYFNESEGLCDPKFMDHVFQGMGDDPPIMILHDPCFENEQQWIAIEKDTLENLSWLDICDIGIREMDNTIAFILNLREADDLALCNFLDPDSLNASGKYYFFLDVDDNTSSGCSIEASITEHDRTPANFVFGESGFEYRLDYEITFNGTAAIETKTVYQCVNATTNTWGILQATISGKKDKACEHESIYFGISKSDIGNPTGTMHIIAFTAEESGGFSSPGIVIDRAYHAYYTPNTIDFTPPDCAVDPAACGSGYDGDLGVMLFENCMAGTGDEDKDGKANCEDEDCMTTVFCAENNTYNASTDKTAPKITSSKVETEQTFALIVWTTNEPATGVVQFYGLNDTCELGVQNISQYDDPNFPMDDYMPTHVVPLDAYNPDPGYELNYSMQPSTTYYYKLRSCDQAQVYNNATNSTNPNCAVSKCLNFTTKPPCENLTNETICLKQGICAWNDSASPKCFKQIEFGFDWTPPTDDPTDPLGGASFEMTVGNETENISAGKKVKTNVSGCNVTLRFKNEMTTLFDLKAPWIIEMQRCCVPKQTINLTNALQIANASNASLYLGLNSGVWQQIAQIMGCKKVYLHLPGFYQDCANISITHCDQNGQNCTLVSMDNATRVHCNSSLSIWELAGGDTTLFSTYTNQYGIDASAPRILSGYDEPFSVVGTSATLALTSNEDCNVTVNYAPCNMTLFNDTGACIREALHGLFKFSDYTNWPLDCCTVHNLTFGKAHSVTLSNLTPETKYFYMVLAKDASGNPRVLDYMDWYYRFTTLSGTLAQEIAMTSGWNLISLPYTPT